MVGQTNAVSKGKSGITTPTEGVWIQSSDNMFYTTEQWMRGTGKIANGVAVITESHSFVIALKDLDTKVIFKSASYGVINSAMYTTDLETAKTDLLGENNTSEYIRICGASGVPACRDAVAYTFPNGKSGYVPALGEWAIVEKNYKEVKVALIVAGGVSIGETVSGGDSTGAYNWSSTVRGTSVSWVILGKADTLTYTYQNSTSSYRTRPFTTL